LQVGEVNRSEGLHSHAAGKGLNVAQVLADLGHRLTVCGFLGEANQQPFVDLFQRRGFVDEFIRVPGETRSNIKLAERSGRVTDLNGPGAFIDDAAQAALMTWNRSPQVSTLWWWPAVCRVASPHSGSRPCSSAWSPWV
jgi:1-phosphofructokinase